MSFVDSGKANHFSPHDKGQTIKLVFMLSTRLNIGMNSYPNTIYNETLNLRFSTRVIKSKKRINKIEDEIFRVSSSGLLRHAIKNDRVQNFLFMDL